MPIDLARYKQLKTEVDELQREINKAEGALEQLTERLQSEFGCKTLEQAEKLLRKMQKEAKQAEDEYNEALSEFEEQWLEVLE